MRTVWRVFAYLKRYPWMGTATLACPILGTLMGIGFQGARRGFDKRATGDLMTRILEDVTSVERMLIDGIEQGVVAVLQLVIVLGMMFYVSVSLSLVGLAPLPVLAGGALWYTLTAHRRYRLQRRASSAMNSLLHDNLAGIRQIKSFVRESEEHRRFNS